MTLDPEIYPYINPTVDRRVVLITGGNSGIGYYSVLQLYLHGHIVYIAGRSKARVSKSINDIKEQAGIIRQKYTLEEQKERFLGELFFLEIDLVNLSSVLKAVNTLKNLEKCLHILINNASAMGLPFSMTVDNFEIQMQTNYVAPFLLTTKLIPLLENSKALNGDPPRIVYLSSIGHYFALNFFDLSYTFHYRPNFIFTWFRYSVAKTAGIHFMKMLALRNPRILCTTVHPGFVMNTNLFAYWTRLPIIGMVFWCFFHIFAYFFGVTKQEGANAVLKLCLDPKLTLENDNGKYFDTNGKESHPSKVSSNMDYAARTWIWTTHELNERNITI